MKRFICRKCGCTAAQIQQPSTHPTQPASVQVTCWSRMCSNYGQTKNTRDTSDIEKMFIVQDDTSADDLTLEILQRRVRSLVLLSRRVNCPTLSGD
jgi:hypothetical protein